MFWVLFTHSRHTAHCIQCLIQQVFVKAVFLINTNQNTTLDTRSSVVASHHTHCTHLHIASLRWIYQIYLPVQSERVSEHRNKPAPMFVDMLPGEQAEPGRSHPTILTGYLTFEEQEAGKWGHGVIHQLLRVTVY